MNLKNTMFVLVIVVFLLQMVVLKQDAKTTSNDLNITQKPVVALSTFALYDIAKNIAKDKLVTYMILPIGTDIHSFEPNPKDIVKLNLSSLVIYSGASLEPWIANLNFKNKNIDMSKHVELIQIKEHTHHKHDAKSCSHKGVDPHYWLSITNMIKATKVMTDAFIDLDKVNKDFYLQNQKSYIASLKKLDELYKNTLLECKNKEILTNHNAFSYLADSYGFEIHSLSAVSPDAEVDAKSMISLIKRIKEHHTSTIFYESFVSSKAMESVAHEANIKVDVLQPLANITSKELEENLSYVDMMKQNLVKLKNVMDCR